MHVAAETEMAVVDRVGKNERDMPPHKEFPILGSDTPAAKKIAQRVESLVADSIPFKHLADDGRALTIQNDLLGAIIVQVSEGRAAGEYASPNLLAQPSLGVFGKRINEVFTKTEIIMEHELSLRRILKP